MGGAEGESADEQTSDEVEHGRTEGKGEINVEKGKSWLRVSEIRMFLYPARAP